MLFLATCMLGGFVFAALMRGSDEDDDNDGPGGGMLVPATNPI